MQADRKLRIVLIEDNISDAKLTQYALSRLLPSPELIHFDTGETFFDYLNAGNFDSFSLVLLDLNLPRMNGPELR